MIVNHPVMKDDGALNVFLTEPNFEGWRKVSNCQGFMRCSSGENVLGFKSKRLICITADKSVHRRRIS